MPATNHPDSVPPVTVSSAMLAPDIIALLVQRKCPDITHELDLSQCGRGAVAGGGFGDIYKGVLNGGGTVAIKCARLYLQQDDENGHKVLKRAARELYIWSRLKHDNILPLLGLAHYRDQIAMISPWMDYGTLLNYIERNPTIDRCQLFIEISEGMAYLHKKGTIHGDIKGGNVLISREGVAKLGDFGCTRALKQNTMRFTTTTSSAAISVRWAAPEVIKGDVARSKEADVYALGMTLLEAITGTVPFGGKTDMSVLYMVSIQKQTPGRPENFASFNEYQADLLWEMLLESWASDPSKRPDSRTIRSRKESAGSCDLRCTLHGPGQAVSRRTRKRCTDRIELSLRRQAALRRKETPGPSTDVSKLTVPLDSALDVGMAPLADDLDVELDPPPPDDPDNLDDITMPSWGLPLGGDCFEYGAGAAEPGSASEGDLPTARPLELDTGGDSEARTRSPTPNYDLAAEWSTDIGYSSGSEADVESDAESHPELDDLFPISPASSRAGSPAVCMEESEDSEPEAQATPENPLMSGPDPVPPTEAENPTTDTKFPDALRAFREWVLKLTSDGDLTVAAAESFLKTLHTCLEKDLLRCGPEVNPTHRLPQTLEALRKHVSEPSDVLKIYAMCPDFSCQALKELSLMDLDKPHTCAKCKKLITRQKIIRRHGSRKSVHRHVPIFRYAAGSVEQQLRSILERPGVLEAMDKHREYLRREGRSEDIIEDIQHGELWRNFKKGDTKFFDNPHNIGLILMFDGFSPATYQNAAPYSVGAISLCIANLPPDLRNRPENKILVGVTPGPHEPNVETINNFLKPMVRELQKLWEDGMTIKHTDGNSEVIHAALIACACDTPAARKVGGFPGTGATYPCTACWCSHNELHMYYTTFPRRSRQEHKRASKAYKALPNKTRKERFISTRYEEREPGGYRYSVLLRLPYWDPSTMVVVDPMHCLFLGLVKFQFHDVWIDMEHLRVGIELKELQQMVESTVRPRHCGRPPAGLGTSAAGSLTSDPLRSLVTIDLPLAIPVLWDKVNINSTDQRAREVLAKRKAAQEKRKAELKQGDKVTREATRARHQAEDKVESATRPQKRQRCAQAGSSKARGKRRLDDIPSEDDELPPDARVIENAAQTEEADAEQRGFLSWRMKDAEGILLLSSAIKQLCSRTVNREAIKTGREKLAQYLTQTAELRGANRMRPNHHISTHLAEQIERYGPMSQIWTYSGERLNFTLKNTTSNRHNGGEREITFAATFHRRRNCISRLANIANNKDDLLAGWAAYMLQLDYADSRGTVGTETSGLHDGIETPATRQGSTRLKLDQTDALYDAFVRARPDIPIRRGPFEHGDHPVLKPEVHPIREVRLKGRIFSMSSFRDSIIKAAVVEGGRLVERVGEIIDLWEHCQPISHNASVSNTFALVRWYKASPIFAPRSVKLWTEDFPELDIEIHLPDDYLRAEAIIPVSDIRCHCARMSANLDGHLVWLTIGLERE